jgi:hypothetical protein
MLYSSFLKMIGSGGERRSNGGEPMVCGGGGGWVGDGQRCGPIKIGLNVFNFGFDSASRG